MPSIWQDMSQLQEKASFPEYVLAEKESPWLIAEEEEEDCESPLFVGAALQN